MNTMRRQLEVGREIMLVGGLSYELQGDGQSKIFDVIVRDK